MRIRDLYKGYNLVYNKNKDISELIDDWYAFMEAHLDIREMCISDYENSNLDWKKIASEKVFSLTHSNYNQMDDCYFQILRILKDIESTLNELFEVSDIDVEELLIVRSYEIGL